MAKGEKAGKERRVAFHAIEGDGDVEAIESLTEEVARRRGIPTLVPPAAPGPDADRTAPSEPSKSNAAASEDGRYVKVWCPDYLLDEIHARARAERSTLSYVLLLALSQAGYTVKKSDLVPDGRARGKRL